MDAMKRFSGLPAAERERQILAAFASVRELQNETSSSSDEIDFAIGDLITKVTGQAAAYIRELTDQCVELHRAGLVSDPATTRELRAFGDPGGWFRGFWASTFESIVQELDSARQRGIFELDDLAYRTFIVDERTFSNALNYLEEKGWDSDFGGTMSGLLQNNLRMATEMPRGSPLPNARDLLRPD